MKKWICLCLCLLLLLSGCGKEKAPVSDRPYDLEIEYGDSGVAAMTGAYTWNWMEGETVQGAAASAVDPLSMLQDIPYVNESKAGELKLLFSKSPDSLSVQYRTSADGYQSVRSLKIEGTSLPAPTGGDSYLFLINAVWEQTEKAACWGESAYYFRYLPADSAGEAEDLSLYRLLQLEASDLFAVEAINHGTGEQKTCRSVADKEAVLDFLKENLSTDFVQTQVATVESDFVLRLACTDGTQLTLGYGSTGGRAWILLGGVPYEAEPMDLNALWSGLKAEAVAQSAEAPGEYLQTSEDFPGGAWGADFAYGYLRDLEDSVTYDEMLWIEDGDEANGYRLETGDPGKVLTLASDCQFWILEGHFAPYCQVTKETLLQWSRTAGWDVLFRLYQKDGQIIAICEQYQP